MTPKHIAGEIRTLTSLLLYAEIAIVTNPVVQQQSGRWSRVTWRSPELGSALATVGPFATVDEYTAHLDNGAYTAVLYDGALLQISYDFAGNDLVGHRLCYYPCPFNVEKELLLSEPIADVIAAYRDAGYEYLRLRSPLRFDFDTKNSSQGHPTVHLHVLSGHCRVPIVAPLSPGNFIRFIFLHFYPELWAAQNFLREWPQRLGSRTITSLEELGLHLSCLREQLTAV